MSYKHLTLEERKCLQQLLSEGKNMTEIAKTLERSVSTISREIDRNKSKHPKNKSNNTYNYNYWRAQTLYICRKRQPQHFRLKPGTEEWDYIVNGLLKAWSPEQIVMRWRIEHPKSKVFGISTIYRYIALKLFPNISRKTHLRRRGKKMQKRNANYNTIHPTRTIPEWPEIIQKRIRIGDWEGDTVHGAVGKGVIVTMVDRKSRYLCAKVIKNKTAQLTKDTIITMMKDLPVSSISLDNGSEFAEFKEIEKALKTEVYFGEPHKPWQRGTNENTNDILRFFYPKGSDFLSLSQSELDKVVELINNRPRKCLGYLSPKEVLALNGVALA